MIFLDKTNKTIKVDSPIQSKYLFEELKNLFFSDESLLCLPFPMRFEEDNQNVRIHYITNGWTFDTMESYKNIMSNILMDEPAIPIVPSQLKQYKTQSLGRFSTVEDLLSKIPKEINKKSVHIYVENDNMFLKIGGVWPNPSHEQEMKTFIRKYNEFKKAYKQYAKIMLKSN